MAGYKDDLDAAHARIRALERELAATRGGSATAPAAVDQERPPRPRPRGTLVVLLLALAFLLLAAALVRQPRVWMALAALGLVSLVLVTSLRSLLVFVRPSELVAIAGTRGLRLTSGRAVVRMPILEQAGPPLDLSVMLLEENTRGVLCRDGDRVALHWYALVSISGDLELARRAVERFLGRGREEIARVATETAVAWVRTLLAEVRAEEAGHVPLQLAAKLAALLEEDVDKLGLVVHGCGILGLEREGA